MQNGDNHSAYPSPTSFEFMRPEYVEMDDGSVYATITVAPYKVEGQSLTRPGARRAAVYQAHQTYRSYNPSYQVPCPFPEEFVDQEGMQWKRMGSIMRTTYGDYMFTDADGDTDYASIDQMLSWDVRPEPDYE